MPTKHNDQNKTLKKAYSREIPERCLRCSISNTRKSVSSRYPNHEKWVEKTRRSRVFFDRLRGVWIPDETLFRVFDMASQTIHNSWRNSKQKLKNFLLFSPLCNCSHYAQLALRTR